ncbi:hypothetical protein DL93DRAFT_2171244 [Clavulina sp. PMI_390]|nr:hypothetical protein DL93DRAFT_2171244 [Clavulina sp. PMI_390]
MAAHPTTPRDAMKSAILASSNSGWSPLRISKPSDSPTRTPGSPGGSKRIVHQTPVRRTSSSFSHVRNNNLVSQSPFKNSSDTSEPTSGLTPKPNSRIPTVVARRVSGERRASLERRRKAMFPDGENIRPGEEDPEAVARRRQIRGLNNLERAEYVSKSPFRQSVSDPVSLASASSDLSSRSHQTESGSGITNSSASGSTGELLANKQPSSARSSIASVEETFVPNSPHTPSTPARAGLQPYSAPSTFDSPRSNLVSRRLHGPRSASGSSRRSRARTVTFNESCDVVEFDVQSFEDWDEEEEVFRSDYEVDYDPSRRDDDEYDSATSDRDDTYMSDPEGERRFISSLVEEEEAGLGSPSPNPSYLHDSRPSTPPSQTSNPLQQDNQDGVPYGRSHHVDRMRAAHATSPAGPPPVTPQRHTPNFDNRPPSPSPARALPRPPTSLTDLVDAEIEALQSPSGALPPLAPLPVTFSPFKERDRPPRSRPIVDPFASSPTTENRPSSPFRSASPVRQNAFEASGSGNSFDSFDSAGRPSPRITRDDVRKRLMKTRSANLDSDVDAGSGSGGEDFVPSRQSSPARETPPVTTANITSPPHSHARSRSVDLDLHQPGVDLGDVRSVLDQLMIGVERGFRDDVSSQGGMGESRDVSFADLGDDTANSSMIDTSLRINEEEVEEAFRRDAGGTAVRRERSSSVVVSEGLGVGHTPIVSPPSPLLGNMQMTMNAHPTSEADIDVENDLDVDGDGDVPQGRTSSDFTEDTEDDTGPHTPSGHSSTSGPVVSVTAPSDHPSNPTTNGNGVPSPFSSRAKYAGLGIEPRLPRSQSNSSLSKASPTASPTPSTIVKDKALPSTPQPQLSLDLGLDESDFGDFATGVLGHRPSLMSKLSIGGGRSVSAAPVTSSTLSKPTSKPAMSGRDIIKAHEQAIIARRRALKREADGGDDDEDDGEPDERNARPQRRRSRSTGDAIDLRSERAAADRRVAAGADVKPSLSYETTSSDSAAAEPSLSASISSELDSLHGSKDRKYLLRERPETIYASYDSKVAHHGVAGDVDTGKAWRTVRRPSDMNEYAKEIREYRAREGATKAHGKVFIKVLGVKDFTVPIPRLPTWFTCTLNNGIHFVTTPECQLEPNSAIDQEFELIEHNKLEFTLTLKVRKDKHLQPAPKVIPRPVLPTPPPPRSTPTPPPQKEKSSLRFWSSSPKKKARQGSTPPPRSAPSPTPPPPPPQAVVREDPLLRFLDPEDGTIGKVFLAFRDVAPYCDTVPLETTIDLISTVVEERPAGRGPGTSGVMRKIGDLAIQMFRLPPLPGIPADQLPQSLEECLRGMRHINWHKVTYHEGVLTQNGGDCKSWRRRQFRVIGAKLVAFNDVTKKATATIELKRVVAVCDDNEPDAGSTSATVRRRARDSYDAVFKVERSFRLVFADEEEIEFFADTDAEKAKWLQIFRALMGRIPPNPLWAELVWQRQQDLALTQPQ